ncbi:hypothetical protein ACD630_22095 [Symbiopectobacterium sp. RP]
MGTSKKQKKREWLRYRDFVLSPYGVIKIKSLGYIIALMDAIHLLWHHIRFTNHHAKRFARCFGGENGFGFPAAT